MADLDCHYDQFIVFDFNEKPVIPDPVPPPTFEVAAQAFTESPWVITIIQMLMYPLAYHYLDRAVKFSECFIEV